MNRILIYWPYFQHYHLARVREMANYCAGCGIELRALAISENSNDLHVAAKAADLKDTVVYLDRYKHKLSHLTMSDAEYLDSFIQEFEPDVILINGYAEPFARRLCFHAARSGIASVLMSDSKYNDAPRSGYKEWIKRGLVQSYAAALVASSHASAYVATLGIPKSSHFLPYDVVDNEFWSAGGRSGVGDYFLSIGRFVPKKNFDFLIRAYSELRSRSAEEVPPLKLVGDGPEKSRLTRLVSELKLEHVVSIEPYQEPIRLRELYQHARLFILASNHEEQWGLVVNEAVAAGTPVVISSEVGCVPDLIEHEVTGLTFNPNSLEDCAGMLERALSDTNLLERLGKAASSRIQRFSCGSFAESAVQSARAAYSKVATSAPSVTWRQRFFAYNDRRRLAIPQLNG